MKLKKNLDTCRKKTFENISIIIINKTESVCMFENKSIFIDLENVQSVNCDLKC